MVIFALNLVSSMTLSVIVLVGARDPPEYYHCVYAVEVCG